MRQPLPSETADRALLFLGEAGRLIGAAPLDEALDALTALACADVAAWAGIALFDGDRLRWHRAPGPDGAEERATGEWLATRPVAAEEDDGRVRAPLVARGKLLGALVLVEPVVPFGGLADLCALAVDREALLRESERAARDAKALAAAREAGRRAAFVNEIGTLLDASLDYATALQRLGEACVPALADWCLIDVARPRGGFRRAASAHADPALSEAGWQLADRFPPDDTSPGGSGWTLREGRATLVSALTRDDLTAVTRSPDEAEALRDLGARSLMTLPLRARGRVLGCVTLIATGSRPPFTEVDLDHATEVVTRAGLAIDNARLFTGLARNTRATEFLAEATTALSAVLDDRRSFEILVSLVVPEFADWAVVDIPSAGGGRLDAVAIAAADPARRDALERMRERFPVEPDSPMIGAVLRTGRSQLFTGYGSEERAATARNDEHRALVQALGGHTALVVALMARGRTLATLTVGRSDTATDYDEEDLRLLEELARRAAIAADNARLYRERDSIAYTLQQSLLPPSLPQPPGLKVQNRFEPGGTGFDVGGDFYDGFPTDGGTWTATIGDVCGKGPDAAALTALARYTLRAAALTESSPQRILSLLNDAILAQQSKASDFCSVALARFEPTAEGARAVVSSAGHPPALVLRADGRVETVSVRGSLLGVIPDAPLAETTVDLGRGDVVVLYTDGIVEARRDGEQWGEHRLVELLARSAGLELATIADRIRRTAVEWQDDRPRDDIALLLIEVE